jgi:hypothetical protein
MMLELLRATVAAPPLIQLTVCPLTVISIFPVPHVAV